MKLVGGHNIEQVGQGNRASVKTSTKNDNPLKNVWVKILIAVVAAGIIYWLGWN